MVDFKSNNKEENYYVHNKTYIGEASDKWKSS